MTSKTVYNRRMGAFLANGIVLIVAMFLQVHPLIISFGFLGQTFIGYRAYQALRKWERSETQGPYLT